MLERLGLLIAVGLLLAAEAVPAGARVLLRFAWLVLRRVLNVLLALLVLFLEWGWEPLVALLGQLRRIALFARIERWIEGLPPYGALAVFALPSALLLPLKFVALYLVAHHQKLAALGVLAFAKIAGTAIVARLFMLTRPKLMQIPWFARLHDRVMPWKEAIFAQIRASWAWRYGRVVKWRTKHLASRAWMRWLPVLTEFRLAIRARLRLMLRRA